MVIQNEFVGATLGHQGPLSDEEKGSNRHTIIGKRKPSGLGNSERIMRAPLALHDEHQQTYHFRRTVRDDWFHGGIIVIIVYADRILRGYGYDPIFPVHHLYRLTALVRSSVMTGFTAE